MRALLVEQEHSQDHSETAGGIFHRRDLNSRLQTTFSAFNDISNQLTQSYLELEQRVDDLKVELALSDTARIRELSAKEALAERLELIVNTMPVAVILLDGRGVIVRANKIAQTLLDRPLTGERWITVINECFAPDLADGHEIALRNGKLVSLATQSLTHEPGQIIVLNDQTETRQLQNKLNHHRKLSEMGKMTASLAHQIRTPLSSAILYADHLASPQLSEERRLRYANKVRDRLVQLEQQVRDMLIFSKGGVVLDSVLPVFQLVAVFQACVDDYIHSGGAHIEFQQEIPAGSVRCNPELLRSIFANLIENAVQACIEAGVLPHIEVSVRLSKGDLVEFIIKDNGPGIESGVGNKILEPFFTTKSTGTGLGLAVVKAVVEAHGGNFSIGNGHDYGAQACVALPLIQSKQMQCVEDK